jgi:hypothetical protein
MNRIVLRRPFHELEIERGPSAHQGTRLPRLLDFGPSAGAMTGVRRRLAEELPGPWVSNASDRQIFARLSREVEHGRLLVSRREREAPPALLLYKAAEEAARVEKQQKVQARTEAPPPPKPAVTVQPPEAKALLEAAQNADPFCEIATEPTPPPTAAFEQDLASSPQAKVLVSAAEKATPFCEICSRQDALTPSSAPSTLAGADTAASEELADDPPTQAAVLEEAAASGAPFCEVCAKAAAGGSGSADS